MSVNDELEATVRSWQSMMSIIGGGAATETSQIIGIIRSDIESALTTHSAYALGRLHQAISQLQDGCGNMLKLPAVFTTSAAKFIIEKSACSPRNDMIDAICRMVRSCSTNYYQSIIIKHAEITK